MDVRAALCGIRRFIISPSCILKKNLVTPIANMALQPYQSELSAKLELENKKYALKCKIDDLIHEIDLTHVLADSEKWELCDTDTEEETNKFKEFNQKVDDACLKRQIKQAELERAKLELLELVQNRPGS